MIHDFGRHAFIFQLSCELARCGHEVHHLSFADDKTPCAPLQATKDHPALLNIHTLSLPYTYNKDNFFLRKVQLMHYGKILAKKIYHIKPDVVVASTTPPDAQRYMQQQCHKQNIPFVFWLQDLFGLAVYNLLGQKNWLFAAIGKYYLNMEKKLLQKSNAIICISECFQDELCDYQLNKDLHVIHNWGALPSDNPLLLNKDNPWSRHYNLHEQCVFMYSGTLGMKHDCELLLALARACESEKHTRLVIISEGLKMEKLRQQVESESLHGTLLLPFQSDKDFILALATADVTLAILSNDASRFSVPSKVLNYMCAGNPTLIAAPKSNQSVQMLLSVNAGLSVDSDNTDDFIEQAFTLSRNEKLRMQLGKNAMTYAKQHFDIQKIACTFLKVLKQA
ncbi:MAG: glycosyltransferase family 4 protein [Mariprofundaceae bacterium]|nr:glycosyltransferase family 4 protein [Mariprofundaceae bacterium]